MKTALSNCTVKSKRGFLQALVLLVLVSVGILSQPALAQTTPLAPCTLTDIDRDDDGLIEICDLEGLSAIRHQLDGSGYKASESATKITAGCAEGGCKGYELDKNLDFNDDASYSSTPNKVIWTTGSGWQPIGYHESYYSANNKSFKATFKGNGYTISNLMINRLTIDGIGLFGYTHSAEIINIALLDVDIQGYENVGGLAGSNYRGTITNSYATGSVEGESRVGGLVGYFYNGNIADSYATGSVEGEGRVGGLVGYFYNSNITDSYATSSADGNDGVGGLVGYLYNGNITDSYAAGAVEGDRWAGGLVGYSGSNSSDYSSITNSYATGAVSGTRWVGGLVGYFYNGNITDSYATDSVEGDDGIGGLVGYFYNSNIAYSYATGAASGTRWIGGLVGYSGSDSRITNSYATGAVEGEGRAGGLVGYFYNGNITDSYAMGSVSGTRWIGGLVGSQLTSNITNSYATGSVSGTRWLGGLVSDSQGGRITNSYWDWASGILSSDGGVGKTTTELQSPTTATGIYSRWSTNNWDFGTSEQYPALKYSDGTLMPNQVRERAEEPEQIPQIEIASLTSCGTVDIDQDDDGLIEICDLEGLNAIRYQVDGSGYRASESAVRITAGCPEGECIGYELNNDLDFDNDASYSSTSNKVIWTTGLGWQPIETYYHPFNTTFKANQYSISNLMIARPSLSQVGLFGNIGSRARIEDVSLIDVDIRGDKRVGGLAGISRGTITTSYVMGVVRGEDSIGGLVGDNHGLISNSYTNVEMLGGKWGVGGIAGMNRGTITTSYVIGVVRGNASVGGLVGDNHGLIINNYTHAEMSGDAYVGGLVGCNFSGGAVTNSYTVPQISRDFSNAGGLVGYSSSNGLLVRSYWDKDVSGISSGDHGVGLTTEELQSPITSGSTSTEIYYGWSTDIWDFGTSEQYPVFNRDSTFPSVEIAVVPAGAVNEGEQITLTASPHNSDNNILPSYSWTQTSGKTLLTSPTSGSSVTLNVPEDYVVASDNTANVVLILEASNDVGSTAQQVLITITKRNNGRIAALGVPTLNERELTAPSIDLSGDPDGVGSNIRYQWQFRQSAQAEWVDVPAAGTNERYTIPADTAGIVQYRVVVSYTDGQGYEEQLASEASSYRGNTIPSVEIAVVPAGAVNEGEQITLTASPHNSDNNILPSYSWTQTSGKTLLTSPTSGSSVTLNVPEDYVVASDNTANVVLILEASNDVGSTAQQVLITIAKRNNGRIAALGVPTLNERELTAPPIDLSGDPDGVGSNVGYQWQFRQSAQAEWVDVSAAGTNALYIIPADTAGIVQFRVVVSYTDGQDYEEELASGASIYEGNTIPSIEIAGVPAVAVNEGERITLTAYSTSTASNVPLIYQWQQRSGKTLLTSPTSRSSVTLNVPEDYVVASDNTANVVLILEASNDVGSTAQQVLITITKRNNGGIAALGVPTLNERELTVPPIDLSEDPDGSGSNIRYQWQSRQSAQAEWIDVPAAGTNALYTIPADTTGIVQYRVVVNYTDGQDYEEELASGASNYISIEIAGVPSGAVNEGERITLMAPASVPLTYHWQQRSGKTLLTSPTSGNTVILDVPEDYVVASASTSNLVITLEASNDIDRTAQRVLITIAKHNNGRIAALGVPTLNERELTASSIDLSGDPDGVGSNIRYQWQFRQSAQAEWVDVPAAGTNERYTIPADTAGIVQYRVVVSYTDGQDYEEQLASEASSYRGNTIPSVEIAVVPAGAVNEGEQITLTASPHNSDNNILPSYSWTQTSGKILLTSPTSGSSVTLDVPEDYVVASDNTANVVLILEASNDVGSTAQQVLITITKRNNGGIAALGVPTLNERELTVPPIDLSEDPDGSGSNIRYQWQSRQSAQAEWVDVPAAGTNALYTIPADTTGIVQYRVMVSYTDGQSYEEQLASGASNYISIEIAGVPSGAVNEGERITLMAPASVPLTYHWQQRSGKTLLPNPTSGSSVTLNVPEDYVAASDNTANVVLILEASNDVGSTAQQVLITIAKRNNGRIAALGVPTLNERELTAPSIDLSGDPDGSGSNIRYQWQIRQSTQTAWVDVSAAGTNEQYTIPADTTGIVQFRVVVSYTDGQGYEEQLASGASSYISIEIAGVPAVAVNEGERITLMAPASVPLTYHWQQRSGKTLLISPTSGSSVTLNVPEDYVAASDNTANVVLILEASNDVGSTAQQVLITIAKRNNGRIEALGVPTRNERELTAPPIDLSGDPDGVGSNIRYQWQSRQSMQAEWVDVPAAGTNALYTIPADTTGIVQYRVMVSYTDGQGYEEQLASGASNYISIEIAGVPSGAVNEGERITLMAPASVPLTYHWQQRSGKTLLTSPTSGSSVTLDVPEDYVVASDNTANVVLILEASNDVGSTAQQVLITIAKRNNGRIAALGVPTLNERELTAPSIDISGDPDGVGSNIRYQWQSRQSMQAEWVDVPAAGTNALYTIPADTTGIVQYRVMVSYTDGQGYEEQLASGASNYISIEIAGVPSGAVNEGERITLMAPASVPLTYHWQQTSGKTLLTSPTSGSSVTLDVPEDYVAASDNTANVVLILEASNDVGSTAQQVLITIAKRNNGRIAALGVPTLNERELTAPSIDISGDPDGSGSNIRYQWQSRQSMQAEWVDVPAAGTNALYTIPADTTGIVQYRVMVSYTDGQGYEEQLASGASNYISIEIAGVPSGAVNEGERITLMAPASVPLIYQWQQTSGKTLLTSPTSGSSVTLDVPEDYVAASDNTANVVLILEASNDVGSTAQQVLITIAKRNNGRIAALGEPTRNERELTAPSIDLSGDPDGVGSNVRYQWQISTQTQTVWANVPGTNEQYTIPADTTGIVQYRVMVSYTDGQGYEEQVESEALNYISIEIAGVPSGAVNEGERITLMAPASVPLTYHWQQRSGKTLLTSPTNGNTVILDVPEDYVAASDNTANVVLILEASNDIGSTAQQVLITIAKRNNGRIAALGEPTRNERELTAPSIDLSGDPDGGVSNIRYQWQISTQTAWVNVPMAGTNALYTIPADTTGIVQYRVMVSYTDGQGYEEQVESEASNYISIEIAGVPSGAVNEGERITLMAPASVPLTYHWQQRSGKTLLTSPTSGSSVTLDVPEDYVAANDDTANVVLILEASNDIGSTAQQVLITIAKRNNGRIAALGEPTRNERELTAPSIDLSGDPDGGVSNIRYQWQISTQTAWVNVPMAGTNALYTIPADTTGIVQYRVMVSYTDGQGYEEQVESEALNYISIEIAGVPSGAVNEGERITLMAPASVPLTYHWQQRSGKTLLTSPTNGNTVILDVPEDYVAASDDTANVVLILEASNDIGSTAQQVLITIAKRNNGRIAALGEPTRNERELTAPPIDLSGDPDGSGSNIRYQWQISTQTAWVNVPMAGTNALYTIPADTTGIVQYRVMVSYTDGQGYEEQVESEALNYISIEIAGVPSGAVNEGERITLMAPASVPLTYHWQQRSGKTLLTSPTSGNTVILDVPEDYVAASDDTANVVLILEASNDIGSTAQQVLITITKRNNGRIAALGVPTLNERELTALPIDLSGDPDGSGSNIRYQWQIRQSTQTAWVNVPMAGTNALYTIPADITGIVQYRVMVSYTDGQGYEEQVESEALSYRGNTSPSIELPVSDSHIRLLAGQTTEVSVVISEVDLSDVVTLTIESTPTIGIIDVEPSRIVLEASLIETRTTQFQLTAEQVGSTKLLLTAIDDSQTATDRSGTVELTIEIDPAPFTPCGYADIDRDDDGLIEICNLEGLDAIRHQLDGSGYKASSTATKITTGCGEGICRGYELNQDLDFNDDGSYKDIANKAMWTEGGGGWQPIGVSNNRFSSIFEGNNNTISNLMIDGSFAENVGLFGVIDGQSKINGIGLLDVDINAETLEVGGLAGRSSGNITNSYVTGNVTGLFTVGGLVGHCSSCSISNSYVIGSVKAIASEFVFETANIATGGLVGYLLSSSVSRSHAIGSVKGVDGYAGGLIGSNTGRNGSIITSYAFVDVEGGNNYTGGLVGSNNGINNKISNSYSIGKVVGEIAVGGLAGDNRNRNTITNSYSFSNVRGSSQVGSLVGDNAGTITNSYATGSVAGDVDQSDIGGLVGTGAGGTANSYWDQTTTGRAASGGGVGLTTAQLQVPTVSGSTSTEVYHGWSEEIWDFGTSEQYPALKYSDGMLIPGQRIGLLSLSAEELPILTTIFNTEVFDYRLLIDSEADSVQLRPTATTHSDVNINIVSGSDFSESVASGSLSPEISLNTTSTTITIEVEFDSGASRSYRITISRTGQNAPAQMAEINTPFEYTIPIDILMGANNNMNNYEVTRMPSWLSQTELQAGLMFSGTPEIDHIGDSSEQMIEIQIDNGDGIIQTLNLMLQIDSPTTGTVTLRELEGGILQLDNELRDDNGIEEVTYIWEHCPVGANVFNELEGVDGMSYAIPQKLPYMGFGTAYRVRTTVVDGLGQRSEHTTQIELQSIFVPEPVIRIRAKIFLEGYLQ